MDQIEIKSCPKCDARNFVAANFCRKCRHEFSAESKKGTNLSPQIIDIAIVETNYVVGSTIHIEWHAENATHFLIDGKNIGQETTVEYKVERHCRIRIEACNSLTSTVKELSIRPQPSPVIRKFKASATKIRQSEAVRISWKIDGAQSAILRTPLRTSIVNPIMSETIVLDHSGTVTLSCATNDPLVFVEENIFIEVVEEVEIVSIESDYPFIIESKPSRIRWAVKNAKKLVLMPMGIDVTNQNEIEVYPSRTTTYRLIASNDHTNVERSIVISVKALPTVDPSIMADIASLSLPSLGKTGLSLLSSDVERLKQFLAGADTNSLRAEVVDAINKIKNRPQMIILHHRNQLRSIFRLINIILLLPLMAVGAAMALKSGWFVEKLVAVIAMVAAATCWTNLRSIVRVSSSVRINWPWLAAAFLLMLIGMIPLSVYLTTFGSFDGLGEIENIIPAALVGLLYTFIFWFEVYHFSQSAAPLASLHSIKEKIHQ